jgi:simple sugar transport system ATP-binding protein
MNPPSVATPILEVSDVFKSFGAVRALVGATLTLMKAEVLALVGDNGAGKSTLAKIISGEIEADEGKITFPDDRESSAHNWASRRKRVEIVYQDLALVPDLAIAQNFFLGRELTRSGWRGRLGVLDQRQMRENGRRALDELGISLPSLEAPVRELSGGQQQAIAVARAVMWAQSVVVMDEPTAALGVRQTELVYKTIVQTAQRGLSVLVISHDIPKMLEVADRIAVMRQGRVVATLASRTASLAQVIGLMLGEEVVDREGGRRGR